MVEEKYSSDGDFEDVFGHPPTLRTYCPGTFIVIGDHIDNHGYSVISMTTFEGTEILATRNGKSVVRIASKDQDRKETTIILPSTLAGTTTPEWHGYVLCGWKAVMDYIGDVQIGFDMLIHEQIPKSCGAGSTTSLAIASALATWAISTNKEFDGVAREEFAELCFISRRYLGAHGTGADEATQEAAGRDLNQMLEMVESLPESASREELKQLLGENEVQSCLSEGSEHMTSFKLRARARYVFSEALRVDEFLDEVHTPYRMGEIMGSSSNSLATEVSRRSYGGRITAWGKRVLVLEDCAHPSDTGGDCLLFTDPSPPGAFVKFLEQG
ncbi:hypothetical protein Aduo_000967 [Ancylostoma duodenale]